MCILKSRLDVLRLPSKLCVHWLTDPVTELKLQHIDINPTISIIHANVII